MLGWTEGLEKTAETRTFRGRTDRASRRRTYSSYKATTIQGALRCDCYTTQRAGGSCGHGLVMCQGRFLKGVRILGRCVIAGACWSNQPHHFPSLTPEHKFSGQATRSLGFTGSRWTGRVPRDNLSEEEKRAQDRVTGQTWSVAPRLISAISVKVSWSQIPSRTARLCIGAMEARWCRPSGVENSSPFSGVAG
jgi:hypothetical protein